MLRRRRSRHLEAWVAVTVSFHPSFETHCFAMVLRMRSEFDYFPVVLSGQLNFATNPAIPVGIRYMNAISITP